VATHTTQYTVTSSYDHKCNKIMLYCADFIVLLRLSIPAYRLNISKVKLHCPKEWA